MQLEIKLDPELRTLIEQLIEALHDLAVVIGPITGYRVVDDNDD